jgi:hypothetical protein
MTSSHHHQLPVFFPNLFQNHPVFTRSFLITILFLNLDLNHNNFYTRYFTSDNESGGIECNPQYIFKVNMDICFSI